MKLSGILATGVAVLGVAACANLERSRSLNDPEVPALATAQQVCSNCHGMDGTSVSPNFPNLAGQTEAYLIEQLTGFRGHSRSDPAGFEYMWGLSRHLTDEQIKGLAAYFAGKKPVAQPAMPVPGVAAAGKRIFEEGIADQQIPPCHTCHGDRAQGNAQFPRLANQHADYLVKQLGVFQRTDERPEGAVMKVIAHNMTKANMLDVAAFLQEMPAQ